MSAYSATVPWTLDATMNSPCCGDFSGAHAILCSSTGCELQGVTLGGGHCGRALAGPEVALPVTALLAAAPEAAGSGHASECLEQISFSLLPQKRLLFALSCHSIRSAGPFCQWLGQVLCCFPPCGGRDLTHGSLQTRPALHTAPRSTPAFWLSFLTKGRSTGWIL